jgi:hypothetical protein
MLSVGLVAVLVIAGLRNLPAQVRPQLRRVSPTATQGKAFSWAGGAVLVVPSAPKPIYIAYDDTRKIPSLPAPPPTTIGPAPAYGQPWRVGADGQLTPPLSEKSGWDQFLQWCGWFWGEVRPYTPAGRFPKDFPNIEPEDQEPLKELQREVGIEVLEAIKQGMDDPKEGLIGFLESYHKFKKLMEADKKAQEKWRKNHPGKREPADRKGATIGDVPILKKR